MSQYINLKNEKQYSNLKLPAEAMKNGELVIFPTETVYGIGTNGLNEKAVERLYEAKKRPFNKPITLLVNSIDMINKVAKDITEQEYAIINKFFPGPLTIILRKKDIVPNIVTANSDTIGIRMPANDIALKLIEYAGIPIATPSANISGKPSGTNIIDIENDFKETVKYFIDNGPSAIGKSSTVIKVNDGKAKVLREGAISKEEIMQVLKNYKK